MSLMASHTVLVMTSAEKLGPGGSRTPPLPSLVARVYRRRAARGEPGPRRWLPLCEALPYTPCARAGPDLVSRVPRATIEAVITSDDITIYRADWVLPVAAPVLADGGLAVRGERIVGVGPAPDLTAAHPDAQVVDLGRSVIMPGFVNCHSHIEYSSFRGILDDSEFGDWIISLVDVKASLTPEEYLASAKLGALEAISSGITTIADTSYGAATLEAGAEAGLRGRLYLEVFGVDDKRVDETMADVERRLAEAQTAAPQPFGVSPIKYLQQWDVFDADFLAVHCVQVSRDDIRILKAKDVAVAHCPKSNAKLGCGVMPLADLLHEGVRVGLGTDSPASSNIMDMFDEMRTMLFLHRAVERDVTVLDAPKCVRIATLGGAEALGMQDDIGSLEPGKFADFIAVDVSKSHFAPIDEPYSALVYGANQDDVLLTVVGGDALCHERGYTALDAEAIRRAADHREQH